MNGDQFCKAEVIVTPQQAAQLGHLILDPIIRPCPEKAEADGYCPYHHPERNLL